MIYYDNQKEFNVEIGKRIYNRRKQLNIKQKDFAKMTQLSVNHIRHIEYGETCMSLWVFCTICNALQCEFVDLIPVYPSSMTSVQIRFERRMNSLSPEKRLAYIQLIQELANKKNK